MNKPILQLYPVTNEKFPLEGLYLNQDLRAAARQSIGPFVFSNYIVSLDGRIAVPHPTRPGMVVPEATANERDWRLFQELAVQADILITTGRYLRDYADGRAQEILQVYDDPAFADLQEWRVQHGLPPQPDLAVVSASLEFPIPAALTGEGRSVVIVTTEQADPGRVRALESETGKVVRAGDGKVNGDDLVSALQGLGYSLIYSTAGPKILHTLLSAGRLDRLYLTHAAKILGGSPFSSIVDGPLLDPPGGFKLTELYLDPAALEGSGQLLTVYDRQ